MAAEAERFVLGENENAAEIGVDAIGKGDVNDAIGGAERTAGLARSRVRATIARPDHRRENDKSVTHVRHGASSGGS